MTDMTAGEIARAFAQNHREHDRFVSKDVYERDLKELRSDIGEIKDSQTWAMRLLVANFLGLVVSIVVFVVTQGIG